MSAEQPTITLRKPQIYTGPKHQTVDEATVSYLREAAKRVRDNRYWGSGVTALVSTLIEDAAEAIERDIPSAGCHACRVLACEVEGNAAEAHTCGTPPTKSDGGAS